jgi:hypothetical protein
MRPSAIKAATTTAICTAMRLDCIPDHHCAGIQHSLFLLIAQEVMTTPMCAVLSHYRLRSVCSSIRGVSALGRLRDSRLQNPGIYVTKKLLAQVLKPQSGPGIRRAAKKPPFDAGRSIFKSVIHTAHSTHTAHATATRHTCRCFLLGRFGDHRLRRDEETGN